MHLKKQNKRPLAVTVIREPTVSLPHPRSPDQEIVQKQKQEKEQIIRGEERGIQSEGQFRKGYLREEIEWSGSERLVSEGLSSSYPT
jgi:hypothetical protein